MKCIVLGCLNDAAFSEFCGEHSVRGVAPRQFTPAPTADEILTTAAGHLKDRAVTYDQPQGERSMGKTVSAFNIITGHELTEAEGWLLLQILKDVRQWTAPEYHQDSAEDCVSYAALKAEALAKGA